MADFSNRWNEYRPSKSVWLWSCAGAAVLTMVVGFGFGGWVTGGTADEMAETSTHDAVAGLAANICTQQVLASADAAAFYNELSEARSYERRKLVEDAGWTTFVEDGKPVDGAAGLCATQILAMDPPVEAPDTATADAPADVEEEVTAHNPEAEVEDVTAEDVS